MVLGHCASPDAPLPESIAAAHGAYVVVVALSRPLSLRLPRIAAELPPGRYAYCGSAYGPGGLRARLARHLKQDKALRWHIDHLTEAGRVAAIVALPEARECDLRAALQAEDGVTVPIPGFGSSDCRLCESHLLALPANLDLEDWARRQAAAGTVAAF